MSSRLLFYIGDLVVLSYIIPLVLFITLYAKRRTWRYSTIGRTLMAQKAAFLVVMLTITLQLFIPDFWFRDWIRLITYSAVAITMWLDYVNLVRVRHTGQPIAFYDPMRKKMTPLRRKKKQ